MIVVGLLSLLIIGGYAYYLAADYRTMKIQMQELQSLRLVNEQQQRRFEGLKDRAEELEAKARELDLVQRNVLNIIDRAEREQRGDTASRSSGRLARSEVTLDWGRRDNLDASTSPRLLPASVNWGKQYFDLKEEFRDLSEQFDSAATRLSGRQLQLVESIEFLKAVPTGWPIRGRITSLYGNRRSPYSSRREYHDGLDIAAPYGTTVRATMSGVVEFAGYQRILGRMVRVTNEYGFTAVYGHNSKLLVKQGDPVTQGQAIAQVGSTGRSTGPHVHYEVLVNGRRVDPVDYLAE